MASIIYLLEKDLPQAREILRHALPGVHQIELVSELSELKDYIDATIPDAVYIGFEWIRDDIQKLGFLKDTFTVVYGEKIDIDSRIKLLNVGISRLATGVLAQPENLLNLLNIHQYRQKELRSEYQKKVTRGSMRDFKLRELLMHSISDRRNLILKIQNHQYFAKLRLFQGKIIEANTPGLTGVAAALKILQQDRGSFRMCAYTPAEEVTTFPNSTFAVLMEAQFERELFKQFRKNLPVENPQFTIRETLTEADAAEDEQMLLKLIQEEQKLDQILWKSPFTPLKTLRLLQQLLDRGIVAAAKEELPEQHLTAADLEFIRTQLLGPKKDGVLLVFGTPSSGKTRLIKTLAGVANCEFKTQQIIDYARLPVGEGLELKVLGVSIEIDFRAIIEKIPTALLANIFLIDCAEDSKIDYTKYVVQQWLTNYSVPTIFGLTNLPRDDAEFINEIRGRLELPPKTPVMVIDPGNFGHIRELLYRLVQKETTV